MAKVNGMTAAQRYFVDRARRDEESIDATLRRALELRALKPRRETAASPVLSKADTIAVLASHTRLPKKQVSSIVEEFAKLAYKEAIHGFTVPGIGTLLIVDRKARIGRNPATGERVQIPARRALKFRIAKRAKDVLER